MVALHCTALHYIALYYIVLYYLALNIYFYQVKAKSIQVKFLDSYLWTSFNVTTSGTIDLCVWLTSTYFA